MPSDRDERIADFVKPFRVEPGSKVSLAKDFDPDFKKECQFQEARQGVLTRRIELLAEYQSWAVRQGHPRRTDRAASTRRRREGRHDSACDERRQSAGCVGAQLQGPVN
jgi:hypothetical protein